jgi:phosphoglycolate phosphatase
MGYELIIFDFDGTLADSFSFVAGLMDEIATRHNVPRVSPEQMRQFMRLDLRETMRSTHMPLWKIPAITTDVRSRMASEIDRIHLFDGIEQALHGLAARGKRLAVVSSNATPNIQKALGVKNAALIQDFEGGVSIFGKTPKIRKVIQRLGADPAQTLYVGDETRDIQAAHQAGVACGSVGWGYTDVDALEALAPEIVFYKVDELLEKIT